MVPWRLIASRIIKTSVGYLKQISNIKIGGIITPDSENVADTFIKFSVNIENTLKFDKDKQFLVETINVFNPVLKAINKYSAHSCILRTKKR